MLNGFILYICYCGCKERKKWNELQVQHTTKSPHFWNGNFSCLRAKKTRNEGNKNSSVFLIKRVRSQCNIFWVFEWLQWVGDHENGLNDIWKYIVLIGNNAFWHSAKVYLFLNFIHQYTIYWEKISNKKLSLRLIECYKKYAVFLSHELKCINAKILI